MTPGSERDASTSASSRAASSSSLPALARRKTAFAMDSVILVSSSVSGLAICNCSCYVFLSHRAVPGFDGLDGVYKRLFQYALTDSPDHQADQPSLEVFALAYDDHVNVGQTVGPAREGVGVARRSSPGVGIGRREDHAVRIGPVVVEAFPNAARALCNISLRWAAMMHLEILVGA